MYIGVNTASYTQCGVQHIAKLVPQVTISSTIIMHYSYSSDNIPNTKPSKKIIGHVNKPDFS